MSVRGGSPGRILAGWCSSPAGVRLRMLLGQRHGAGTHPVAPSGPSRPVPDHRRVPGRGRQRGWTRMRAVVLDRYGSGGSARGRRAFGAGARADRDPGQGGRRRGQPGRLEDTGGGGLAELLGAPIVLGWDVAGVVDALGAGVTRFAVGDRVFGMPRFPHQAGAYAEYVTGPSGTSPGCPTACPGSTPPGCRWRAHRLAVHRGHRRDPARPAGAGAPPPARSSTWPRRSPWTGAPT